jgi:hypothetical protein
MNYFIFYNVSTFSHYCWNGIGVIPLLADELKWAEDDEITEQETRLFKELETDKRRTFEIKSKGKFAILQRGQFKTDTDE